WVKWWLLSSRHRICNAALRRRRTFADLATPSTQDPPVERISLLDQQRREHLLAVTQPAAHVAQHPSHLPIILHGLLKFGKFAPHGVDDRQVGTQVARPLAAADPVPQLVNWRMLRSSLLTGNEALTAQCGQVIVCETEAAKQREFHDAGITGHTGLLFDYL